MTVKKAKELLHSDISRRENLIEKMKKQKSSQAEINASTVELEILNHIMRELENP